MCELYLILHVYLYFVGGHIISVQYLCAHFEKKNRLRSVFFCAQKCISLRRTVFVLNLRASFSRGFETASQYDFRAFDIPPIINLFIIFVTVSDILGLVGSKSEIKFLTFLDFLLS